MVDAVPDTAPRRRPGVVVVIGAAEAADDGALALDNDGAAGCL